MTYENSANDENSANESSPTQDLFVLGASDHNAMPPGLASVNEFSDEQADREIGSVLYDSPSVAFLDNINGRLESDVVAKLLTA